MNIHRIRTWHTNEKGTFATDAARALLKHINGFVETYCLYDDQNREAHLSIFRQEIPVLFTVSPSSPPWAEEAVRRCFNEDGTKKPGKWQEQPHMFNLEDRPA